jgi:hypothetical protein
LHVAVLPIPLLTLPLGLDVVVDFMLAVSSAVVFPCSKAAFSWPARAALRDSGGGAFSEAGRKLVTPL